jgi:transcriptional regulator with XRE-family HTH domain
MNTVEMVKSLCKERGIPVSRLEKACGFANGYIGQLKKGSVPADRLAKIASFFEVPIEALMEGTAAEHIADNIAHSKEMHALIKAAKGSAAKDLLLAAEMLNRMKGAKTE